MSLFSGGYSTRPFSATDISGSLIFIPTGVTESAFNATGSALQSFLEASGSVLIGSFDNDLEIKNPKDSFTFFYISSSNNNPRIGVGTIDPKSTFDFKDEEDSAVGTEITLRSARTSLGAITGDEGGSINFTIDSSSFNQLKTSGSLGKIRAKVNSINQGGAQGSIAFTLSKGFLETHDALEVGYGIGSSTGFNTVLTSSLEIVDFNSAQESTFTMKDDTGNTRFSVNDGLLYASGNISSSGNIIGTINGGTF